MILFVICCIFCYFYNSDIDECASFPCKNGGTCYDYTNYYVCQCPPGFTGDYCETGRSFVDADIFSALFNSLIKSLLSSDIDECASLPCKNGGTCYDYINYFTCHCPSGYTGEYCETGDSLFMMMLPSK